MINFNSKKKGGYPPPFLAPLALVLRPLHSPAQNPIVNSLIKVRLVILLPHIPQDKGRGCYIQHNKSENQINHSYHQIIKNPRL